MTKLFITKSKKKTLSSMMMTYHLSFGLIIQIPRLILLIYQCFSLLRRSSFRIIPSLHFLISYLMNHSKDNHIGHFTIKIKSCLLSTILLIRVLKFSLTLALVL